MEDLFVSIFIFSPIISFLSNPRRRWNKHKKSTGRYISILIIISAVFYGALKKERNYFEILKVFPHSSTDAIKKSFKSEAFLMHPDRNSSATANEDYFQLVEKYKLLSTPERRRSYSRFADLISQDGGLNDIGFVEVIYIIFVKSFTSIILTCFLLLSNGCEVISHPVLIYEIFLFALDVYLRFSSDSESFMSGVPMLRSYTVFELITFFRDFRVIFLHHSSLFVPEGSKFVSVAGVPLVKNDISVIENLDNYIIHLSKALTSRIPRVDSDIAWRVIPRGINFDKDWNDAVQVASTEASLFDIDGVEGLYRTTTEGDICWLSMNRSNIEKFLNEVEEAINPDSKGFVSMPLILLVVSLILNFFIFYF